LQGTGATSVAFTSSLTEPPQKVELNGFKRVIICLGYLTVEEQRFCTQTPASKAEEDLSSKQAAFEEDRADTRIKTHHFPHPSSIIRPTLQQTVLKDIKGPAFLSPLPDQTLSHNTLIFSLFDDQHLVDIIDPHRSHTKTRDQIRVFQSKIDRRHRDRKKRAEKKEKEAKRTPRYPGLAQKKNWRKLNGVWTLDEDWTIPTYPTKSLSEKHTPSTPFEVTSIDESSGLPLTVDPRTLSQSWPLTNL
jgi:hypothetical protein